MIRFYQIGRRFVSKLMVPTVLMMFASLALPAAAEDTYQLLVKMKNNEEKAFLLAKKPVVSFTETECVIDYDDFTGYFDMGDIKDIAIVTTSGVDEISTENVTLDYTDPDHVVVRGLPSGAYVTLHTLNGLLIDSISADDQGNAPVNMSAVSRNEVCILSVNSSKNFKICKK